MKLLFVISLFVLGSCGLTTTRPKIEMSLAQEAFMAARESGADVHASNLYRSAEDYYLKAKSAYRRKYFNKAKNTQSSQRSILNVLNTPPPEKSPRR